MRDYGQADKVIVDIITLDSEACAPCQYMVEAVKTDRPEFEGSSSGASTRSRPANRWSS